MKANLLFSFLILLAPPMVWAQGTAFTYQGRLNDGSGPANGVYDVAFTLYDTNFGGAVVGGPVTNNTVGVTNGLFATEIDFGAGVFTGSSNWMEIAIRTNGAALLTTLAPRQQLTPTPYSIFAESANNLSGTLGAASLSGAYGGSLTFNNSANTFYGTSFTGGHFSGDGSGLTNLNPSQFALASGISIQQNAGTGGPSVIEGSSGNYVASGVVGATIGGGGATNYSGSVYTNKVTADFGTVAGGQRNFVTAVDGTVGGGIFNTASGNAATVAGGDLDVASGSEAVVSGGTGNTASGNDSTVAGGSQNNATALGAAVGGGNLNSATNINAVVPGGKENVAGGISSFAAGQKAQALHNSAFVWADSQINTFSSTADDQFLMRAQGGVGINMNNPGGASLYVRGARTNGWPNSVAFFENTNTSGFAAPALRVVCDGGTNTDGALSVSSNGKGLIAEFGNAATFVVAITNDGTIYSKGLALTSDRNAKENFTGLDSRMVLAKVAAMPVTQWNYKDDDADRKHIGPVAQDFSAAFGLNGGDDQHISVVDESGVALAAIQGLNQKVEDENQSSKARMQKLEKENAELRERLAKLERLLSATAMLHRE